MQKSITSEIYGFLVKKKSLPKLPGHMMARQKKIYYGKKMSLPKSPNYDIADKKKNDFWFSGKKNIYQNCRNT